MKKLKAWGFFLSFIGLWAPININAFYCDADTLCSSEFEVEVKFSAFFPSSKIVRCIYSDVMPYYEIEVSKPFCNDWQMWLGAGYISNHGHAIGCGNKTDFQLIPITGGIKYFYQITPCIDLYAGAGACVSFFNNRDHSPFVHKSVFDGALGGIFESGLTYFIQDRIYLNVFTEYLYQHFSFKHKYEEHYTIRHNLNMSGLKIGGGIGIEF